MEPMYVQLPVKNTFIHYTNLAEPPMFVLPKSTTAPAEYHASQLQRHPSRTVSTQTPGTQESSPTEHRANRESFYEFQNRTGSFYGAQGQESTDSEPTLDEEPIPDEEPPLQEGQLRVTSDRCGVQWAPDRKRLGRYSAEHQVLSSRFELQICGRSIVFLLMIRPSRTQNRRGVVRAAFKNTQQRQIQLKCLDELEGLPKIPVQVTFTIGTEQRQVAYDFQTPVCEPVGSQSLWDLPDPKRGEKPVVIAVTIAAGPSRW